MTERPCIRAYTREGVIEIPLTGDAKNDALLERFVKMYRGPVTDRAGDLTVRPEDPSDQAARSALKEGA